MSQLRILLKRYSLAHKLIALVIASTAIGCDISEKRQKIDATLEISTLAFKQGEYVKAKAGFIQVIQDEPDNYHAILGLGNACRELGSYFYTEAYTAIENKRLDAAKIHQKRAEEEHNTSYGAFKKLLDRNNGDSQVLAAMGLLFHQRAIHAMKLSPVGQEFDAQIEANCNEAIDLFKKAIDIVPKSTTTRKFLAMVLVTKWELKKIKEDITNAKRHLEDYVVLLKEDREKYNKIKPSDILEENDKKQIIETLSNEISFTELFIKTLTDKIANK